MAKVQGTCDDAFNSVREAMQQHLDSGEELGASVFVEWNGKSVVDIWGGFCDEAHTRPWTENTITNVWSLSKTVTNLSALVLADRGLLDLDENVATYWPEFGANGKENIKVRHILAHTSGVSGWDQPFATEDMYDSEAAAARLAAQAPWWEPGTASGYHAQNQGHLVGELVRRVTGKPLKQFIAEEIAGPLQADFQLGARESDLDRVSDVFSPPDMFNPDMFKALDPSSPAYRTFSSPVPNAEAANTSAWKKADMGATNGHANARSIVRVMSTITKGGENQGVRLLSRETRDRIFEVQAIGVDLVLGVPMRWGIGYGLPNSTMTFVPEGNVCFWGGWGGSLIIMDVDRGLTIGYVMNKMSAGTLGSVRGVSYIQSVYEAIRKIQE